MWAQLIAARIKVDVDTESIGPRLRAAQQALRAAEQPGSGLLRTLVMQDQADPRRVFTLVVFESEERSGERRGGKEWATRCRWGWSSYHCRHNRVLR